jgi:hypothetical protein
MVWPGATSVGSGIRFCPPNKLPVINTTRYEVFQAQVPAFFNLQTLVNELPGAKTELSGTVRSATNSIRSQPRLGVGVGDWNGVRVGVRVLVGVLVGVLDGVAVADGVNVDVREGVTVGVNVFVLVGVRVGV